MKTTLPSQGETYLKKVTIELWVDYKIASRPEAELRRIFETQRIEGDGLIITGYKEEKDKIQITVAPKHIDTLP
jgi:hypothetical protein